jgi:hypothetical protein
LIDYYSASPTALSLIQSLTPPTGTNPESVTYVDKHTVLIVLSSSSVQKYLLSNDSILFVEIVFSGSNYLGMTFLPGSKAQGFIGGDSSQNLQTFYYNGQLLTPVSTFLTASNSVCQALFATNPGFTYLIILINGQIRVYAACSPNGCAAGGCDYFGNCLNGCTNSTPARIGANCTCPPGYVDNGLDAQCEVAYNST